MPHVRRVFGQLLRPLGGIRIRAALLAACIVGIAFAGGAIGTVALLRSSLDANVTNTARAEALDLASFVTSRARIPVHLPISDEAMAAQIISHSGSVLSSSRNIAKQGPITNIRPRPGETTSVSDVILHVLPHAHVNLDLDERYIVAATGLSSGAPAETVLVASSLGAADHAVDLLSVALGIAVPVLMLLIGILVWGFMGRSLRPVELIRAEVAALSATDLARRVPEPAVRDEIGRLAHTMNAMLGRLETSAARQRQLVADVAHELRNPLASLRAQLEVAVAHPGPESVDLLRGAVADVARTARLLDDLLTLARFDEQLVPRRLRPVDLDDVILQVVDHLRERTALRISVQGVHACRIEGDEDQLLRLVINLGENAIRYARSQVTFSLRDIGDGAVLTVADDGPGIPAEMHDRVFERFVRLDDARAYQGDGAGLGLAIVREIATSHKGGVRVEDAHPGARFVVHLPRTQSVPVVPVASVLDTTATP
jgi:signal transduction histidine kinase